MVYLLYFVATLLVLFTQFLYYDETWRNSPNFFFWGMVSNIAMFLCWLKLVRIFGNNQSIYLGAIYWDIMYFVVGYGVPLLLFGVKLNWMTAFGIFCVLTGILIVQANFPH